MTKKRAIAPLPLADIAFGTPPTAKPEMTWMAPSELLVDESYQRGIGEKGTRLIQRICEGFDWRRFKPPTAVWTDEGLEVVDGQHSAIAACMHPDVDLIPICIVEAEQVADRAGAFLGLNRDRLAITPMALHAAAVVAGDPDAAAIERVCQACDVKVLRMPPSGARYRCRETVAVRALDDLIKRIGEDLASVILRTVADAELAPITTAALRATEAILCGDEYADQVDPAELTKAIITLGPEAEREAGVFAATHCVPRWRGLTAVWFRKARKRKPASPTSESTTSSPVPSPSNHRATAASSTHVDSERTPPPQPADNSAGQVDEALAKLPARRRTIYRQPRPGESYDFGDPPPGRSALDQQRAKAGG